MVPTLRRTPRTGQGYIEPELNFTDALPLHMVSVPGSSFMMGAAENSPNYKELDGPQHKVTVKSFLMSRYSVTQKQWQTVAKLSAREHSLDANPSNFKGDNHPVEQVSWHEALEFCHRLEDLTGRPYRLPTEAEWEYACRAGTTTPYYFGDTVTTEVLNCQSEETTPVDKFAIANGFGLSDMHGNIWEWCLDHWHNNYERAPTDGSSWLTTDSTSRRVCRGGSWGDTQRNCRSDCRYYSRPESKVTIIGFRVVCSAPSILR